MFKLTKLKVSKDDAFWEGGASEHADAFAIEYKIKVSKLETQIVACKDGDDLAKLQAKLKSVKLEYKEKLKQIDDSLY